MVNLGITYRLKGDIRKSKAWFEKAIETGDGSAALELAKLYECNLFAFFTFSQNSIDLHS
jgi:TPR repeat protein